MQSTNITTKTVIYCRVSSLQQETGFSLDAQERLLKEYAAKNNFKIEKIYRISESASGRQIRKTFNEMLRYVTRYNIPVILCEKIDRLTRNPKDAGITDEWVREKPNREVHFVKESFVVNGNTKAHENLVWNMKVAIAKFYSENLSEEVRKGQKEKLAQGQLPRKPPLGYKPLGDSGQKVHSIDENVAPYIRTMFEWYATGNYSLARLESELYKAGLRSRSGKKVCMGWIHRLLTDPFFYGKIRWKREIYRGEHEPIISKELFDIVQRLLKRKIQAPHYTKHNPVFKSKIRCKHCHGLVTWYSKKGFWYGHCNNHGEYKKCPKKTCIRQDRIEAQLLLYFDEISPKNEEILGWIEDVIREEFRTENQDRERKIQGLTASLEKIRKRKDQIYEDKIDGIIPVELYQRKVAEYVKEEEALEEAIRKTRDSSDDYEEISVAIHKLAYKAKEIYEKATTDEKRLLLSQIFTNILQDGLQIKPEYTIHAQYLAKWTPKLNQDYELQKSVAARGKTGDLSPVYPNLRAWRESLRTMEWGKLFPAPEVTSEQIMILLFLC